MTQTLAGPSPLPRTQQHVARGEEPEPALQVVQLRHLARGRGGKGVGGGGTQRERRTVTVRRRKKRRRGSNRAPMRRYGSRPVLDIFQFLSHNRSIDGDKLHGLMTKHLPSLLLVPLRFGVPLFARRAFVFPTLPVTCSRTARAGRAKWLPNLRASAKNPLTHTCIRTHARTHTHTHISTHTLPHTYMHANVHSRIYTSIYIHRHTHLSMLSHSPSLPPSHTHTLPLHTHAGKRRQQL